MRCIVGWALTCMSGGRRMRAASTMLHAPRRTIAIYSHPERPAWTRHCTPALQHPPSGQQEVSDYLYCTGPQSLMQSLLASKSIMLATWPAMRQSPRLYVHVHSMSQPQRQRPKVPSRSPVLKHSTGTCRTKPPQVCAAHPAQPAAGCSRAAALRRHHHLLAPAPLWAGGCRLKI